MHAPCPLVELLLTCLCLPLQKKKKKVKCANKNQKCTKELKICPDGTKVGRDSKKCCKFKKCPGQGKKKKKKAVKKAKKKKAKKSKKKKSKKVKKKVRNEHATVAGCPSGGAASD